MSRQLPESSWCRRLQLEAPAHRRRRCHRPPAASWARPAASRALRCPPGWPAQVGAQPAHAQPSGAVHQRAQNPALRDSLDQPPRRRSHRTSEAARSPPPSAGLRGLLSKGLGRRARAAASRLGEVAGGAGSDSTAAAATAGCLRGEPGAEGSAAAALPPLPASAPRLSLGGFGDLVRMVGSDGCCSLVRAGLRAGCGGCGGWGTARRGPSSSWPAMRRLARATTVVPYTAGGG